MNSILFICPYFGKLPASQFELWLKSCGYNSTINWIILTNDKTEYALPPNVKVINMNLEEFKSNAQQKFDFPISLETPYKLCDYKPMYGYLFPELIESFDFWGHSDMSDCIFGDLRKFLTDDLLSVNDKLLFLGHMTLYRNKKEVNERILLQTKSGISLEQIIGVKENKAFDELNEYSINRIYEENNFSVCRIDSLYADVSPMRYAFQLSCYDENFVQYYQKKIPRVFEWNEGHLFDCQLISGEIHKKELGYVHFQKRKMNNEMVQDVSHFLIVPEGFASVEGEVTAEVINKYSKEKLFYKPFFDLKYAALKYRLRRLVSWR